MFLMRFTAPVTGWIEGEPDVPKGGVWFRKGMREAYHRKGEKAL
jgi:hypothetical protein